MIFTLRGKLRDSMAFIIHLNIRRKIFRNAPYINKGRAAINRLSDRIHPGVQNLVVSKITEPAPGIKRIRLRKKDLSKPAYFRAGQYIVLETEVHGKEVSRPYSLSCSPEEMLNGHYYEITVKEDSHGLVSPVIVRNWKKNQEVFSSSPMGTFHFDSIRDRDQLLFFAGGSGITPFRSLVPQLLHEKSVRRIVLFYGFNTPDEYLFQKDFISFQREYPDIFKIIPVIQNPGKEWEGESGLINHKLLKKYISSPAEFSWFICGPEPMKINLMDLAEKWEIPRKQVRFENFTPDATSIQNSAEKTFKLTVHRNDDTFVLEVSNKKTLVQALENAGLNPPAYCRSGECGWCRSRLIRGRVFVPPSVQGIRAADREFGYIHPCCSYPLEDCEIKVHSNPLRNIKKH